MFGRPATFSNAIAEVRSGRFPALLRVRMSVRTEATDCVRLGPVASISPGNFPLGDFYRQAAAALAAGNTVLAKPAEETPLIAAEAVRLHDEAGLPKDVLQFIPGGRRGRRGTE